MASNFPAANNRVPWCDPPDPRIDCECGFRHDPKKASCEEIKRLHDTHDWHQPWKLPEYAGLWQCKKCKTMAAEDPPAVLINCNLEIMKEALE
jgi:hypothetical protein